MLRNGCLVRGRQRIAVRNLTRYDTTMRVEVSYSSCLGTVGGNQARESRHQCLPGRTRHPMLVLRSELRQELRRETG